MLGKSALLPLIIWVISQGYKFFSRSRKAGRYDLWNFVGDGGMPSSHTAIVTSLTTVVAMESGVDSIPFGISLIFSLIIIHDALNVRVLVGAHSRVLNQIRSKMNFEERKPLLLLPEKVGHTIPEVGAGLLLGIAGTILLHYLF